MNGEAALCLTASALMVVALIFFGGAVWRPGRSEPRLTITLEIRSSRTGNGQTVIIASAELHNPSGRTAKARSLTWECRKVAPYTDEEVERIATSPAGPGEYNWDLLRREERDGLSLRPGERRQEQMITAIPGDCEAAQIILRAQGPDREWRGTAFHDIRPDNGKTGGAGAVWDKGNTQPEA